MSSITEYYKYAELSFASYADLQPGIPDTDHLTTDDIGMSQSQANDFAGTWVVVDQYDGTAEESYIDDFGQEHYYINHTGLNVTLFQNTETGEQVVAIRGTELNDISDLLTDVIDIGTLGSTEHQAQYQALTAKVKEWMDTGLLTTGFTVTGHSLGGYLATNLAMEYFSDVTHTYIYNAPGLDGIPDGDIFSVIYNALLPGEPLEIPHNPSISNIIAPDDIINLVGLYPSTPISVSVEPTDALGAHSIIPLTDALAVYSLLSTIGNSNNVDSITPILKAASLKEPPRSLENVVEGLAELLVNPITLSTDDREAFYQAIYAIETELFEDRTLANPVLKPQYQGLTLTDLSGYTQTDLANGASSDIAIRYAIVNLNPFAVSGNDSLYDRHNQSQELDLYDESTREGSLTAQYLDDRAHFLYVLNQSGLTDSQYSANDLIIFHDKASDELITQASTYDHTGQQFTFGTNESDAIAGGEDDDHLYGAAGDDKLSGNAGADYLEGGEGDDTYIAGDGDTILDTDGFGRVLFGDIVLFGGVSTTSQSLYQSRDGKASYRLLNGDLIVTTDEGELTIKNFQNGDLGISLDSNQPAPVLTPLDMNEGESQTLTLNLDRAAGEFDEIYRLVVDDPDLLTLSGSGVVAVDPSAGVYEISVAAGASSASITATALNDGDIIVNAVHISVEGVLYADDGTLGDERILQVVNVNIDDTHYSGSWYQVYGTSERDTLGPEIVDDVQRRSKIYAGASGDTVWSYGEISRGYGEAGDDYMSSGYTYDDFDGLTVEEIADYVHENFFPDTDYSNALEFAVNNRANRDAGHYNDWADGGIGNDYLYGGDGEDYLSGGDGIDYLSGDGGNDILLAGEGERNLITGGAHDDTVLGGNGADYIFGDAYIAPSFSRPWTGDLWYVTYEDNTWMFHNCSYLSFDWAIGGEHDGSDHIFSADGDDFIVAGGLDDIVDGGNDNDYIEGNGGSDTILGGEGDDRLFGAGGEQSSGSPDGDDYIDGGAGQDRIEGGGGSDTIYGGGGNDTIFGGGDDANLYLTPDSGDFLYGGEGSDHIEGGLGNDLIDGGSGEDEIGGGEGDDRLFGGSGNDIMSGERDNDFLYGESGEDTLFGEVGDDSLYGGDDIDYLYGGEDNDKLFGGDGGDGLYGGDGDDKLFGGDGGDGLYGDDGDDKLYGEADDDYLDGGAGDDYLDGGAGNDSFMGGAGDDVLYGGVGNDTMDGGEGNDTYILDASSGSDVIRDQIGTNIFQFSSDINFSDIRVTSLISSDGFLYAGLDYSEMSLVAIHSASVSQGLVRSDEGSETGLNQIVQQVEGDYLVAATGGSTLTGTALGDRLVGGTGADSLVGDGGDDWLEGGSGNDVLSGGDGTDALLGGSGFDSLYGEFGDDYLDGGSGGAVLYGGYGSDTYAYSANSDDVSISDTASFSSDVDRLIMHEGIVPDDVTPWREGDSLKLYIHSEANIISISRHFESENSGIEQVVFSDGTVWDRSYFTPEVLSQGADAFTGTSGDDVYSVDHPGDTITEQADSGTDTVHSAIRYSLPDNVENLVLEGATDISGYGNALDNHIVGNAANNLLDGMTAESAGGDVLEGGEGDDTYVVRHLDQVQIIEQAGEGTDTLICYDTTGCVLPDNVENLTMETGGSWDYTTVHLTGNALDNVLIGFAGRKNYIDGGEGADEMWGGSSEDYYVLDNPGDTIHDYGGSDTAYIYASYTDSATYVLSEESPVDNLTFDYMGTSVLEAHGNSKRNKIVGVETAYGHGGNDELHASGTAYGGDGIDWLTAPIVYGGMGDDIIMDADVTYYQLGEGNDSIRDTGLLKLEGAVSLHQLDISTLYGGGLELAMPDGASVDFNTDRNLNTSHIEFVADGAIYNGHELLNFVRDQKLLGDAAANTIELSGTSGLAYGLEGDDYIQGSSVTGSENTLVGGEGNDELVGGVWGESSHDGGNWLFGGHGDDQLTAGTGNNNYLYGGSGNDRLHAGTGRDDSLYGESGDDAYVLDTADGDVAIIDSSDEFNTLSFSSDVTFDSLGIQLIDGMLHIHTAVGGQTRVYDWNAGHAIKEFHFADGEIVDDAVITALDGRLLRLSPNLAADQTVELFVNEYNDPEVEAATIAIEDRWIEIDEGLAIEDIVIERHGEDLTLRVNGQAETVTVNNWFHGHDDRYKVSRFRFMDGGELTFADIEQRAVHYGTDSDDLLSDYRGYDDSLIAGAGNDILNGGSGHDLLDGGTGDDQMSAGTGDDTIRIGEGEGHDTVDCAEGGFNTLQLTGLLTADRLSYLRDGLDLVIQVDDGSLQSVRILNHFSATVSQLDQIVDEPGTTLSAADIAALLPDDSSSDTGGTYDNEITGDELDNELYGTAAADLISGEGGADTIFAFQGDDRLLGGEGDDYLSGGNGSNDPGDGNDQLVGGAGNDTLFGEGGDDTLSGGLGDDKYYYKAGGGQDSIDNAGGGSDGLFFLDVTSDRLSFHQEGDDLIVLVDGDLLQQVRVIDHFLDAEHAISYIQPNGGYSIMASQIEALLTALPDADGGDGGDTGDTGDTSDDPVTNPFDMPDPSAYDQVVTGTASAEQLIGSGSGDYLDALAGDDQLFGLDGNDALLGGDGADYLDGGNGNDIQLAGGGNDQLGGDAGDDSLSGGLGDDIYVYRPGSGADLIDNSEGGVDWLIFTDDLTSDRLSYYRSGDDMVIRIDEDATQQVTVKSWYAGAPLSYIQPAGGYGISASQIESMAGTLSTAQRSLTSGTEELASLSGEASSLASLTAYSVTNSALAKEIDLNRQVMGAVSTVFGKLFAGKGWSAKRSVEQEGGGFLSALLKADSGAPSMTVAELSPALPTDSSPDALQLCIKPLPGLETSAAPAGICIKPIQPLSVQYDQMVTAMAGFTVSDSAEPLRLHMDESRNEVMLAVGGVN